MHPEGEEVSETDEARVSRYEAGADPTPRDEAAQATPGQAWHELLNMTEGVRLRRLGDLLMAAGSVMGLTISREFQADMAAGWKARAETAEAELADARERLRRCEERLAAVKALHRRILDGEHCLSCLVRWPCPTTSELQ